MSDEKTAPSVSDLVEVGLAAVSRHQFKAASRFLKQAVEADPSHSGAWMNLGYAYTWLHRFDAAEEAFAHAIALATAQGDACRLGWIYRYRGHLWHVLGHKRRALADYEMSVSQGEDYLYGPGDPEEVYMYAAQVYEELGDYSNAVMCVRGYQGYYHYGDGRATSEIARLEALRDAQQNAQQQERG